MAFRRFIVLPSIGFESQILAEGQLQTDSAMQLSRPGSRANAQVRVLDQISSVGPKLIDMSEDGEIALAREFGGEIRVIPLHYYELPRPWIELRQQQSPTSTPIAEEGHWQVSVVDHSGRPIKGAIVVALTNFRSREGERALTGEDGTVDLPLKAGTNVQRLYVYGPVGFWGAYRNDLTVEGEIEFKLEAIDLASPSLALARYRSELRQDAGNGVRIGVVDSGIMVDHPNLIVAGGRNCVFDEISVDDTLQNDWDDVHNHVYLYGS
jgi:subtilisin